MNGSKSKYKFNIIDVLIIIAVVAVFAVMYYYMSARNTLASSLEVDIEYVVELKLVDDDYVENIKLNDKVIETVRDQQIGEVVGIEVVPAYNIATNTETGEMKIETYPPLPKENDTDEEKYPYYNVKVKIRDTFKRSEKGYKKNAFNLVTGQLVYFRVPGFIGEGFCIGIEEIVKENETNETNEENGEVENV